MMGDPGTSNSKLLYSRLGTQSRDEFRVPAPGSALEPSEPSFSNSLHGQHPLFLPSSHHHPAVSFWSAGCEAWSNRDFEGGSVGPRNCAQERIQNRSYHSEDTLDVMARARVDEDDLLTFPEGEVDAVTITARDLASLQPGKFLTDNIVDFYIQYLKVKAISPEHQNQFHFFNSFFFPKLLETTASLGVDECRVDFLQLRKWIGDVNLFEKDFVFVPVIASSHWSLIVICHLRSLNPSLVGERKGSPCILHLDPIEGKHEPFEDQMKSFILQAWVERFEASNNLNILHSLFQMKFAQAKVPQQGNGYDCGLYILHYIEVFLLKATLQDLIVSSSEGDAHFTRPNFTMEVFDKRKSIQHLIFNLGGLLQVDDGNCLHIPPMLQEKVGLMPSQRHQHQGLSKVVKEVKSKKWKEMETLILLECVVGGGRFSKGKLGAIHWDLIAEEINSKNSGGPLRSKEQCQNRFDTLLKAYKDLNAYCLRIGKEFCNVTEDEKRSLKLATPLGSKHEEWYNHLHTIYCRRSSLRGESHKRRKLDVDGAIDVNKLASSPIHPSQQSPPHGSSRSTKPSSRQLVVQGFNALNVALRYTFLNLIQVWPLMMEFIHIIWREDEEFAVLGLEVLCRRLAIVQDQNLFDIRKHVYQLHDLKLVKLFDMNFEENYAEHFDEDPFEEFMDKKCIGISDLEVYKKLERKVLRKNPNLNIVYKLLQSDVVCIKLCPMQHIRVLSLYYCQKLENVDLRNFLDLRVLDIKGCMKLKVVHGWEGVKRLGWIGVRDCLSFCNLSNVEFPSSLNEFHSNSREGPRTHWQLASFSQCIQLRRLEILYDYDLVESMDLKAFRFLEVLDFSDCEALSTIHGLTGLQTLMRLSVRGCESLKMLPDLGCLKALTYLDMVHSGIVEIPGVEELHSLILLGLRGCKSLESLPPLGHLKALAYLDLSFTSVEEILGVEGLVSLEILLCCGSNLKRLPSLQHLHRLQHLSTSDTPLSGTDPPRSFVRVYKLIDNERKKEGVFVDDISDISDINDFEDISYD